MRFKEGQIVVLVKDIITLNKEKSPWTKYFGTPCSIKRIMGYNNIFKQTEYVIDNVELDYDFALSDYESGIPICKKCWDNIPNSNKNIDLDKVKENTEKAIEEDKKKHGWFQTHCECLGEYYERESACRNTENKKDEKV